MTYEIKNWERYFENSESRKYKKLSWVPVTNKHDGKTFGRLKNHKKCAEIFAGWILILELASKMPVRGILEDEDGPLTAEDMALKTGFPQNIFELALNALSESKMGWIRNNSETSEDIRKPPKIPPLNRTEQNRTEEIGHRTLSFKEKVKAFSERYPEEMLRAFFEYWIEQNPSKTKLRFELEKTWDTKLRLIRWARREGIDANAP